MALTPEQILNKHFQTTQFRKGYDERDVDDFLDDVVAEMRALTAQRDDYEHQFEECQSRSSTVASNRAPVDAGVLEEHERRLEDVRSRIAEAEATEKEVGERLITAQAEVAAAEAQVRDRQGAIDASVQERLDAAEGRARAESEAKAAAEQKVLQLENELRRPSSARPRRRARPSRPSRRSARPASGPRTPRLGLGRPSAVRQRPRKPRWRIPLRPCRRRRPTSPTAAVPASCARWPAGPWAEPVPRPSSSSPSGSTTSTSARARPAATSWCRKASASTTSCSRLPRRGTTS